MLCETLRLIFAFNHFTPWFRFVSVMMEVQEEEKQKAIREKIEQELQDGADLPVEDKKDI